jgi:signal transduction histidine kinase/DNA-binding response OmpR family regulator
VHTISFKGIPIFKDYDYYAPQLWLAARYVESFSMLAGFALLGTKRRLDPTPILFAYAVITGALIASILYFKIFPVCFIAGKGLTPFKIVSEYVICAALMGSIVLLYICRRHFDALFFRQILVSLVLMIASELCFTRFVADGMNDIFNEIGHLLKVCAFYLIYKAVVVTALRDPMRLLFRELTASEGSLREAQQLARLGRWELDLATGAWKWTEEMYRFFSVPASTVPTLDAMLAPLQPRDQEALRTALAQPVSPGASFELMLRTGAPREQVLFGQLRGEVMCDESGKAARLRGTLQDVTEQQLLIEGLKDRTAQLQERTVELLDARDAAEAANKAKTAFLANMSHELRTPLNAILGFSSLMRRDPGTSSAQRETLDIINRSGEHLLTLINDVLEMAKIEAGRLRLEIAPLDLGQVVRDVAEMMRIKAEEKGLQLQLDQSSSFPRFIKGDRARLRQILVNLTGNAVKFTEKGTVTIRLRTRPDDGQYLIMEVEDTGTGIKPEDQQCLFQPFVQLAESKMQIGTGLGLAITRQFVELMGGTVSLESTLGKGSIFRIELPVELDGGADIGTMPSAAQAAEVCGLAPGQPEFRILIVEDQPDNQVLMTRIMAEIGLSTRLAENGLQAVELFQEWHPHLIWMDRRMPVMNGVEATQRIRQLPGGSETKIVAVTASILLEERQMLLDAGMDDYVRKPYRVEEIRECLARHLGLKYLYRSSAAKAEADVSLALTSEKNVALPAALREALQEALTGLDSERIDALIRQVQEIAPEFGQALARLAENFDYQAILNALMPQTPCSEMPTSDTMAGLGPAAPTA